MKVSFFTNMKDKLNKLSKLMLFTSFHVLLVNIDIGKTEQTLFEITKEHVTRADSLINGHLDKLKHRAFIFHLQFGIE